jgi:hypothetical protein
MRLDRQRRRQILSFIPLAILGACGSADNLAGGTVGTETGNALTAQLHLEDGQVAAGARVVLRPAQTVDSSSSPLWQTQTADANGTVVLQVPRGTWTLEMRSGKLARRRDIVVTNTTSLSDTLKPTHQLSGYLPGIATGTTVQLPGLARWTSADSNGTWQFDDVPDGTNSLACANLQWQLPDTTYTRLVLAKDGSVLTNHQSTTIKTHSTLTKLWLPDSLVSEQSAFVDVLGRTVPTLVGTAIAGMRPVWMAASSQEIRTIGRATTPSPSPFSAAPNLRLAWIPDLDSTNLAFNSARLLLTGQHPDSSASEGATQTVPLGLSLGTLTGAALPDTGAFALLLRNQLQTTAIGSLWLLNWSDSAGTNGLAVGIGNNQLVVRAAGWDTTLSVPNRINWANWAIVWDGKSLSVACEGTELLQKTGLGLQDRSTWSRQQIGLGGGMQFSAVLTWKDAQSVGALSQTISAP